MGIAAILCLIAVAAVAESEAAAVAAKPFKCAGHEGECETGLCYDALGFYEERKNIGCAPPEMCQMTTCQMFEGVFTCCCANRFCNAKSENVMWFKYRQFKANGNVWSVHPKHMRNATTPHTESEIRKSPPVTKKPAEPKTAKPAESPKPDSVPQKPADPKPKPAEQKPQKPQSTKPQTTTSRSRITTTTVGAAPFEVPAAAAIPQQPAANPETSTPIMSTSTRIAHLSNEAPPSPNVLIPPKSAEFAAEGEGERTTRSSAPPSPTTQRPKKAQQSVKKAETGFISAFPWYYVTIVGLIVSILVFAAVFWVIRRYRQRGTEPRVHSPTAASVESSRVSEGVPNEGGVFTADPLLAK